MILLPRLRSAQVTYLPLKVNMEMKIDKPIKMEMEWRHKKSNKPRSEKILEFIIKSGGISCIILILAILFFILKESAPFLISRFDFKEFFF